MPANRLATDDRHDVVIVNTEDEVQRFPVDRGDGRYWSPPETFERSKPGGRKAQAIAKSNPDFGLGFGIAPTRPEPAAQNGTCIIVNQQNVRAKNPWTAARLNNEPDVGDEPQQDCDLPKFDAELPPEDLEDNFDILLAGRNGRVYRVTCVRGSCSAAPLPSLQHESELWYQLRNGLVVGCVPLSQDNNTILPLVNVTSLMEVP